MRTEKMTTKCFSLSCEDQPGLLARVLQHFSRPGYALHTVLQSRTDVSEIVLLTLEVVIPGAMVDPMIRKLNRIIGVLAVTVSFGSLLHTAIYRLLPAAFGPELCGLLNGFQARLISQESDGHLLVEQLGRQKDIQRLYDRLEGPELVGFCQQPVAISQPLDWEELKDSTTGPVSLESQKVLI